MLGRRVLRTSPRLSRISRSEGGWPGFMVRNDIAPERVARKGFIASVKNGREDGWAMRFKTRFDKWLVVALIAGAVAGCGGSVIVLILAEGHGGVFWLLAPVPLGLVAAAISSSLPQYYDIEAEGVLIRQGWRKAVLPYGSLRAVRQFSSSLSAPVFSTHRVEIVDDKGAGFVIAVADEEEFLIELKRRSPRLNAGSKA